MRRRPEQISMLTLMGQKEYPFYGFTIQDLTTDPDGNVLSVTTVGPDYPTLRDGFGRALEE